MLRALVVEDDDLLARLERSLLVRRGFEVSCASNLAQALRLLVELAPTVALIDLHLEHESGVDVVREMRASGRRLAILAVSGSGEAREEALAAGADGFLSKPFAPQQFMAAVLEALTAQGMSLPPDQ